MTVGNARGVNLLPPPLLLELRVDGRRARLFHAKPVEGRETFRHVVDDRVVATIDRATIVQVAQYGPEIVASIPETGFVAYFGPLGLEPVDEEGPGVVEASEPQRAVEPNPVFV